MRRVCLLSMALLLGLNSAYAAVCPKYVVEQGDSIYSIAQKFEILADELNAAIQACGQDTSLLQIGQEICLPGGELPGCTNVRSFESEDCKVYITQQGDTITSVAAALDLYQVDLQNLNADVVANGILQPGKYLKLPPWSQTCGDPNESGESCRVYIVNSGDFIAGIASAFSVSIEEVLAVNPGLNAGSVLQNGQPIKIPPFPASCGAGTPAKPPTDTVLTCRGYRVQQGDNINSIAQAFKTTVNELTEVNPELSGGALIQPGTIVKIPPYDNTCEKPILVEIPGSGSATGGDTSTPPAPVPVPPATTAPVPVPPATTAPVPVPPATVPVPPVTTATTTPPTATTTPPTATTTPPTATTTPPTATTTPTASPGSSTAKNNEATGASETPIPNEDTERPPEEEGSDSATKAGIVGTLSIMIMAFLM